MSRNGSRNIFFSINLFLLITGTGSFSFAQPCLSGWNYRVPVTIDNSANAFALTNFQTVLEMNTSTLVLNGKTKSDGGDIRVADASGTLLTFWIETGTFNSSQTRIWIQVPSVSANGTATVYLFYGNPSATNTSNGDATFELFDDFTGSSVNASKWNTCNIGNTSVAAGKLSMTGASSLTSAQAISAPVKVAIRVTDFDLANDGYTFIGLINDGTQTGFASGIRNVSSTTRISHQRIQPPGTCYTFDNESLSGSTVSPTGLWQFWWPAAAEQRSRMNTTNHTSFDNSITPLASQKVVLGNANMNGIIGIDYVYVRKHVTNDPAVIAGAEMMINIPALTATNNGTLCEGQDLVLTVTEVPGADYSWTNPSGSTIGSVRELVVPSVAAADAGTYSVTVSIPGGCASSGTTTPVQINATTQPGSLVGDATVCHGNNNGSVTLTNHTGNVIRWETSQTGAEPWASINNTTAVLSYTNVIATAHYRAVVKNGVCTEEKSNAIVIQVSPVSVGGDITGTTSVCEGSNTVSVRSVGRTGDILRWETSTNGGGTWIALNQTQSNLAITDLAVTTAYRAVVKSGVCAQTVSIPLEVKVNPLPAPGFQSTSKCQGEAVAFTNTSSVSEGSIRSYLWEFGDGSSSVSTNPQHVYLTSGSPTVTLTATTSAGCSKTIDQAITVYAQPSVNFGASQTCDGFPTAFINQSSIAHGSLTSFSWDFGDGTTAQEANPQKQYFNSGTYLVTLRVLSNEGCEKSQSKNITVDALPVASFTAPDVCLGSAMAFRNSSYYNAGSLTYQWRFGDGNTSVATSPAHRYAAAGVYQVKLIATTAKGCQDSVTRSVEVRTLVGGDAGPDVTISKGSGTVLQAQGGVSYLWQPVTGLSNPATPNPVASPTATTVYQVLITDALGCTATDNVTVTVVDDFSVTAMNILTPNGDGVNDTWKISNIENYGSANVYVFDRNGTEVFSAKGYQNDWKGNYGNDLLPDGTYYYFVSFDDSDVVYKGSLTILRNKR
jgi:gliding motility-associated-like protein